MSSEVSTGPTGTKSSNADESQSRKMVSTHLSENGKNEPFYSDIIPHDILFALTEANGLIKSKEEQLAPLMTLKTPKEMRVGLTRGAPDGVWHHKNRRLQFRHLTDHPKSDGKTIGSKDLLFLYDISGQIKPPPPPPSSETTSRQSQSTSRRRSLREGKSSITSLAVPDSILPGEYHLVKTKAVAGLDYADDWMTTGLLDKDRAPRTFPSLKPTKRFEVVQLIKTMNQMLSKAGVDDLTKETLGPTQIHNLLEIIKKEQLIYDIVFHEVIRQVSIECLERGQLISKLRQRYADLLNRVPQQIKNLHAEVMAQRSLDRRLTEELLQFKASIGSLTNELIAVREHDRSISYRAETVQLDLAEALKESEKNANLVGEYYDLYELQRRRLEAQVVLLAGERDLWCDAAYCLSLKIISEHSLTTANRLHVTEKAWHKIARHFNVMISDHDKDSLAQLQLHVDRWRDLIFNFQQDLKEADETTKNILISIKDEMRQWITLFEDTLIGYYEDTDIRTIKLPPLDMIETLQGDIALWEQQLGENTERFVGDTLLSNQEQLIRMKKEVEKSTDVSIVVYDRHRTESGENYHQRVTMSKNNELFRNLTKQLDIRITGENGTAKGMITLQNSLDTWNTRFVVSMRGAEVVSDSEWLKFYDQMLEYEALITETVSCIGSVKKEEGSETETISIDDTMESVKKWFKDTVNGIEGENGKMAAQISTIHTSMVHWMVQLLLLLAPDKETKIPSESSLMAGCSLQELATKCRHLTDHLSRVTTYLCGCAKGIVQLSIQQKRDAGDDNDADVEYEEFLSVKTECQEWISTCEILLNRLLDKPMTLLDPVVLARLDQSKMLEKRRLKAEKNEMEKGVTDGEKLERIAADKHETLRKVPNLEDAKASTEKECMAEVPNETTAGDEVKEGEAEEVRQPSPVKMERSLEVIGADENVQFSTLDSINFGKSQITFPKSHSPPPSSLAETAYDAIVKMDQLQQQLLNTEERAQTSESKNLELQQSLNEVNEKISALRKQLAEQKQKTEPSTSPKPQEPSDKAGPTTPERPPTTGTRAKSGTPESGKRGSSKGGADKKKTKAKKK